MRYLSAEEILLIHYQLIEKFGGSHGVRDINRVKSAALAPSQSVFGEEQYKSLFDKAAVYARNIILDHPFVDGNKRTGISTAIMFLCQNGYNFKAKEGELEDFAVYIATAKPEIIEIAKWLKSRTTKFINK